MMKSVQVGKAAEAVLDLQPAKVVLLVCVSGASSAAFWIASVAPVLISCKMRNLELETKHPFCLRSNASTLISQAAKGKR